MKTQALLTALLLLSALACTTAPRALAEEEIVVENNVEYANPDQSSRISCVADFYGPSDFTQSYGKSVDAAEVLPLFLGGNLEQARERHVRASPLYWVTPDAAPTLCIHGTKDPYVAFEQ